MAIDQDEILYDETSQKLRDKLVDILGSEYVYYNPPQSVKLHYPCIRFILNGIRKGSADDRGYLKHRNYTITLIHKDPDNLIVDDILDMPLCTFERSYIADNFYHFVFTKYI